ncbi:sensor domain-containing protein [Streptomyces olivoreticuli]|uniref:sensor histidine kinase n=1 Tax=Streptomyces olivoreticuli TaxID=68246 RepID=UPI00265813F1|nr:sensor histidine kinase [Streptomyces olivoreticuli]WKK22308.1 sensor domain-containing protein [Streptomyces olivoreticuli]
MKIVNALLAAARGLWLTVFGLVMSTLLFAFTLISLVLMMLGVGFFTTPVVLSAVRSYADQRRRQAEAWSGVRIPAPYRTLPARRGGFAGQVEHCLTLLKDKATWRDVQWLFVDLSAGAVLALLPATLIVYVFWGLVLALGVWKPIVRVNDVQWFAFVPVTDQFTANLAAATGLAFGVLGIFVNQYLLRAHFLLAKQLLQPTRERELALRVEHLTETRHDAVDSSAAELRRIERDLHDGAQARLVAMGMSLGTIEALIEQDPAQAKRLLATARADSAEALAELRDLVRGIHPPVLAERGLGDALRALALRMPLPVEVEVQLPGRAEEPVESAAYFAVSEVLTNAAKHSRAQRVWLDVRHAEGALRISVTDNGRGGAAPSSGGQGEAGGTGLVGIERRLGAFDGVLAVSSPAGGPTMVTMEIPCTLR